MQIQSDERWSGASMLEHFIFPWVEIFDMTVFWSIELEELGAHHGAKLHSAGMVTIYVYDRAQ